MIISRQSVIPLLRTVMVAPITSAIHGVPSEVMICTEQGLKRTSAINLDHVQTVEKSQLRTFVARLDEEIMSEVCRALGVATGCVG